jgi:hypothetical protein
LLTLICFSTLQSEGEGEEYHGVEPFEEGAGLVDFNGEKPWNVPPQVVSNVSWRYRARTRSLHPVLPNRACFTNLACPQITDAILPQKKEKWNGGNRGTVDIS